MEVYTPDPLLIVWQIAVVINAIMVMICLWHIVKRASLNNNWLEAFVSLIIVLIPFVGPIAYLIVRKKLKPVA